jgi:hypothetical protein
MTVPDIAASEQTTTRTIQRYITVGFRGHKLPAVRLGNAYSVTEEDYRQWRIDCGFDVALPVEVLRREIPQVKVIAQPVAPEPEPVAPEPKTPCKVAQAYPPYPMPADPHGVPTNCPHPHSCTFPHPKAVADHLREVARAAALKYHGDDYAEPEN